MTSTIPEETDTDLTAAARAAEAHHEAPCWRTSRPRRARQGKVALEGHAGYKSAQRREENRHCTRREQDREDPHPPEAAWWRNHCRADERDRLAGAFCARVRIWNGGEEDGAGRRLV